jgi:hypothetical protein
LWRQARTRGTAPTGPAQLRSRAGRSRIPAGR